MKENIKTIKNILFIFLISTLLTGCGKKESVSLYGKAYNYSGEEHITRSLVFADQKCALGMDMLCVLDSMPLWVYADYTAFDDKVILTTENDEKLVFERSDNDLIYREAESQTSRKEGYLSDGMKLEGWELTEDEMQRILKMTKLGDLEEENEEN